ncbi:MAG: hypothetical protein ACI9YB_000740, partial [Halioglobus sp.]
AKTLSLKSIEYALTIRILFRLLCLMKENNSVLIKI